MEPSDLEWLDMNLQLMEVCGLGDVPVQLTFLVSCWLSLALPPCLPLPVSPAATTTAGDCRLT